MALKGSKTEGNLKAAFAGESQANRRYLYFAGKADVEGYNDVAAVFREVARVTRAGGLYVSQHKSPVSLQATLQPNADGRYELEHPQQGETPLPAAAPSRLREPGTQEFIHSFSALCGGICAAGFVIEDVGEPDHAQPGEGLGTFAHRAAFLPPYIRVLARKRGTGAIFLR